MKSLMESGKINKQGQFIDCYNQAVYDKVAGVITTRVDHSNHYWVTVLENEVDKVQQ